MVRFRLKIGKKDILSLISSNTVDKKWQNYTGKALGNKTEFCNLLGMGCAPDKGHTGKDCSNNAKKQREHRTAKAFVNRISYPIIVMGLSNFISCNSSGKRPVLT